MTAARATAFMVQGVNDFMNRVQKSITCRDHHPVEFENASFTLAMIRASGKSSDDYGNLRVWTGNYSAPTIW